MADGTGVSVDVSVEVGAGIVEVAIRGGEVGIGVGVLPQPVTNKPATVKSTTISLIRIRAFLPLLGLCACLDCEGKWECTRVITTTTVY